VVAVSVIRMKNAGTRTWNVGIRDISTSQHLNISTSQHLN